MFGFLFAEDILDRTGAGLPSWLYLKPVGVATITMSLMTLGSPSPPEAVVFP